MKAFGYIRVSGKGQVEGDGLQRQRLAIEDYAALHGIELVDIYADEGISGTLEERPALGKMMVSLEQNGHGVKTVIIEKIDRLARDLMVQEYILTKFRNGGFQLTSTMEGDDLASPDLNRTLIRQVMGAFAEYEKKLIVIKLKAARDRIRAQKGKCEGGKGYKELAPATYDLAVGLKNAGCSYTEVAVALNEAGHLPIRGGGEFTRHRVIDMLRVDKRRERANGASSSGAVGSL